MAEDYVLYEASDAIATITINRPDKYNALNISVPILKVAGQDPGILMSYLCSWKTHR